MRGKDTEFQAKSAIPRITPAHAGKSRSAPWQLSRHRDHPRTCGEKLEAYSPAIPRQGSPPHMRGKVAGNFVVGVLRGITPAHAGKREKKNGQCVRSRDHPRTCGEKRCEKYTVILGLGSPPHMRGKVKLLAMELNVPGITPAHAGKRCSIRGAKSAYRDHPRTCGEKIVVATRMMRDGGSPPHMRGKVFRPAQAVRLIGITPAHAGKRKRGGI